MGLQKPQCKPRFSRSFVTYPNTLQPYKLIGVAIIDFTAFTKMSVVDVTSFFRTSEVYESQFPRTVGASFRNKG